MALVNMSASPQAPTTSNDLPIFISRQEDLQEWGATELARRTGRRSWLMRTIRLDAAAAAPKIAWSSARSPLRRSENPHVQQTAFARFRHSRKPVCNRPGAAAFRAAEARLGFPGRARQTTSG